jgi:DNA-binding MarR family transcriptional regulator
MKSYELAHQMLNLIEEFENQNPGKDISLQNFAGFFLNHVTETVKRIDSSDVRFGDQEPEAQQLAFQIDNAIGRLVVYMSRYAKFYIKKALDKTPLQTAEDFTCLAILLTHDNLLKGELISRNIQEKTSGTEVIRRLIAAGLVEQSDDENDKRSKRIAITQKGRELLYVVFNDMNNVGKIVTGNLNMQEKLTLQFLLQKLENFHHDVYHNRNISSKSDLQKLADENP